MKKYRLIKIYPGFSVLGTEITCENETSYYTKNPEFWEEVIKKDYEVYQVLYATEVRTLYDGLYRIFTDGVGFDLDYLLKNDGKIHSVKRLSDDEVFTIGDNIGDGIITEIHICDSYNGGVLFKIDNKNAIISINAAKKVELPIRFTTKDGVDIREGDEYWFINDYTIFSCTTNTISIKTPSSVYFSTREAAEAYQLRYKPCLSLDDIQRAIHLPPMHWEALLAAAKLKF